MKNSRLAGAFLPGLLLLILASCSSLPQGNPEPISAAKAQAAKDFATLGAVNQADGNFTQAERYYLQSLEANWSIDNLEGVVESNNSLGNMYLDLGDNVAAQRHFTAALEGAELAGSGILIGKTLANRAKLEIQLGQYEKALETLVAAEKGLSNSDGTYRAVLFHNRGVAYYRLGRHDEAKSALQTALGLNTGANAKKERAANLYLLASVESLAGEFTNAKAMLLEALKLDKLVENTGGIASDLFALYHVSLKLADKAGAYQFLVRAFRSSLGGNNVDLVKKTLEHLPALAKELGKSDDEKQWIGYRDSLSGGAKK